MSRLLVPVAESDSLRETIRIAGQRVTAPDGPDSIRLVYLPQLRTGDEIEDDPIEYGQSLLATVTEWLEATAPETPVTTAVVGRGTDRYTPRDIVEVLLSEIDAHDIDLVVLDPNYGPAPAGDFLDPLERILTEETDVTVEVATERQGLSIPTEIDPFRVWFVFVLSFVFYLILAGGISMWAIATGLVSAAIVTVTVGAVTFWFPPGVIHTPIRFLRALIYIPYLLLAITRANIEVSRVILHPALPIETRVVRYHPAIYGPFPVATLANSITLTPGTLSMRIENGDLLVHTLTEEAREGLLDGELERAVRFLFFGRKAMRIASPRERGDATVSDPPPEGEQ